MRGMYEKEIEYKGYVVKAYGVRELSVFKDGKEIMHTLDRHDDEPGEDDLKAYVDYIENRIGKRGEL